MKRTHFAALLLAVTALTVDLPKADIIRRWVC